MTTALVTGASRGIGRATARGLAERGLALAILGKPSAALESACAEFRNAGATEVRHFACDLSRLDQITPALTEAQRSMGTPDVLLHSAGIVRRGSVEHLELHAWEEQLNVHLTSAFLLTRAVLAGMRARGSGRLIFVSSISATLGSPRQSAYAASKWGLVGFMKSLAEELKDSGLMTCAVLPGSVDTEMLAGSGFEPRMTAEDVAKTLIYFSLDAPLAHNGAAIEMFGV